LRTSLGQLIGRTKGGMNINLHTASSTDESPFSFFPTVGQLSNYPGAAAILDDLQKAQWLLGDHDYDGDCSGMPWAPRASSRAAKTRIVQRAVKMRQAPLAAPQPYRDRARLPEGLAARRKPLRPKLDCLLLRHSSRGHHQLPAMTNES
jgi:hypothetical protein